MSGSPEKSKALLTQIGRVIAFDASRSILKRCEIRYELVRKELERIQSIYGQQATEPIQPKITAIDEQFVNWDFWLLIQSTERQHSPPSWTFQ